MTSLPPPSIPFLERLGLGADFSAAPIAGGANNRVYRVCDAEHDWVLKYYYQNPADPRDRFLAERGFYQLLWDAGIRQIPEPVAWVESQRLGVFAFIPGRKLTPSELRPCHLTEAIEFIAAIQNVRYLADAIPMASEACLTLAEHLRCVERRFHRLIDIQPADAVDREVLHFVQSELGPGLSRLKSRFQRMVETATADPQLPLPSAGRCLSPSDFGFHNAILDRDGRLRFFDFEYAGWDDPAKLVCDFFCQPQIPVNLEHWKSWIADLVQCMPEWEGLAPRASGLLPLYQYKWCCIMLNEFVQADRERRAFSNQRSLQVDQRLAQLNKARTAWQQSLNYLP